MHSSNLQSGPSGESGPPNDPSVGPSVDMVARLASLRLDRSGETVVETGRYTFSGVFASGGLGVIRRAYDRRLQRDVAVKELRYYQSGSVGEQRFLREALITARLEHPAIVPIHDIGQHDSGEPFFCMKLVDGRSLRELVRAQTDLTARIGLLPHVIAVTDAIAYAHDRRIVHRDLKPTNVLIGPFGETVVIDWGLAKDLRVEDVQDGERAFTAITEDSSGELTESGEFVGTLPFMPPSRPRGPGAILAPMSMQSVRSSISSSRAKSRMNSTARSRAWRRCCPRRRRICRPSSRSYPPIS